MNNIILIGMPGSGKTRFGEELARVLERPFYDADRCLEMWEKRSVTEIFSIYGEKVFRDAETRTLRRLSAAREAVIASGGGAILRPANRLILRKAGCVCWIDRSPEEIARDIVKEGRPLLQEGKQRLWTLYRERRELYARCSHVRIRNDSSFEEVLACIAAVIKERER